MNTWVAESIAMCLYGLLGGALGVVVPYGVRTILRLKHEARERRRMCLELDLDQMHLEYLIDLERAARTHRLPTHRLVEEVPQRLVNQDVWK